MGPDVMATIGGTLGGGMMGAVIKILMSLVQLRANNAQRSAEIQRDIRLAELNAQVQARETILTSDDKGGFSAWTRRLLALSVCWTLCAIAIMWAIDPAETVQVPRQVQGWAFSFLGLVDFQGKETATASASSTGSIVWAMLPFMSMILTTYFTPSLSSK